MHICEQCNINFKSRRSKGRFCSHKCYGDSLVGKPIWNKGMKGKYKLWPNGRVFSDDTKKKMSLARKGKKLNPIAKEKMLLWRENNPELAHLDYWCELVRNQLF